MHARALSATAAAGAPRAPLLLMLHLPATATIATTGVQVRLQLRGARVDVPMVVRVLPGSPHPPCCTFRGLPPTVHRLPLPPPVATKLLQASYPASFKAADMVLVTDIYASGEDPIEGVSIERLVDEINISVLKTP